MNKQNTIVRATLMIMMVVGFFAASAQGELINQYLDDYAADENYVKVSINSRMFSLFTELEGNSEEEKEFLEAVAKLKGLKILASDSLPNGSRAIYDKTTADVDKAGYEELMTVKDAEEDIKFSIKEKKGIIEELIMVVGGNKNFVFLSLYGEIDLKTVSKLATSMNVDSLKGLKNLDKGN
ncbi:MAG: DUF4252 domain-containing protein [Cytophagales bacterium]|nr:DUF4252 domain-containing protein [Cytophagales bacterium]